MTWDEVVEIGRRLPGVEVSTSYGTPALKVGGKLMTRLRPEDESLVLLDVEPEEREFLIGADPNTFHVTPHYVGYPAVLVRLSHLDPATLHRFLERRWRHVAPKRLVREYDDKPGSTSESS